MASTTPHVGLFVTCLVDVFRPQVGFASVQLLEQAGCRVSVPRAQTCCGQPAFNNGDDYDAREIARRVIVAFADFDYVVAPSGSCAGMLRKHYPALFAGDVQWRQRAADFAGRCHELTAFLYDVLKFRPAARERSLSVTYHDSCSGLRELGVRQQPRALLAAAADVRIEEMQDAEVCCGFGGTFCVKYPEVSVKMVSDKTANIEASGAGMLLGGDMGCLLNIAGRLRRQGSTVQVRHVAEVLAGLDDQPAIGEAG